MARMGRPALTRGALCIMGSGLEGPRGFSRSQSAPAIATVVFEFTKKAGRRQTLAVQVRGGVEGPEGWAG